MTDKITISRAVMELALAWLEALTSDTGRFESEVPPIAALRAALAERPAEPVAYLDVGAQGFLDLGSDLSDDQLSSLPKGRHMLGIIGTYGVDGYKAAAPEALRLADHLEHFRSFPDDLAAAAELRRLHDENEALRELCKAFDDYLNGATSWTQEQEDRLNAQNRAALARAGEKT